MIDTKQKSRTTCGAIVEQDLGPPRPTVAAPDCGSARFMLSAKVSAVVWADGYLCFGKCQVVVMHWIGAALSPRVLGKRCKSWTGGVGPAPVISSHRPEPPDADPPPVAWQIAARWVVDIAEETLWSPQGEHALNYLVERGLSVRSIQAGHLGYMPGIHREWRKIAGLSVPCGITIPWLTNSEELLWAVKVRRSSGSPKYLQIAGGSSGGLYQADRLRGARAALFCEGEFDALLAHQEGEPLVSAVTLGSASNTLNRRWLGDLVRVPILLAAYDRDEAGC